MKQTAMQIMLDELLSHGYKIPFHLVVKCKELLEMEKEQIENAYQAGQDNVDYTASFVDENGLENYYNETYGGNNAD